MTVVTCRPFSTFSVLPSPHFMLQACPPLPFPLLLPLSHCTGLFLGYGDEGKRWGPAGLEGFAQPRSFLLLSSKAQGSDLLTAPLFSTLIN